MPERPKAIVSWSTGKDSAYSLCEVIRTGQVEVAGILTTVTSEFVRVSMHGVREELLDRQVEELGVPCWKVSIPSSCPNEVYEREMARVLGEVVLSENSAARSFPTAVLTLVSSKQFQGLVQVEILDK